MDIFDGFDLVCIDCFGWLFGWFSSRDWDLSIGWLVRTGIGWFSIPSGAFVLVPPPSLLVVVVGHVRKIRM